MDLSQPPESAEALLEELTVLRAAPRLGLLLDYDGTLVPHADVPEMAIPDPSLLDLLQRLAARANTDVHIVSGRTAEFLDRRFAGLPVVLHAEHGALTRLPAAPAWDRRVVPSLRWQQVALPALAEFARHTPGALVEFKETALAWHWRGADPLVGAQQAAALHRQLQRVLGAMPVEFLWGDCVLELRPRGVHKGLISAAVSASLGGTRLLAAGNDRTDEDLFAALSRTAVTIAVGDRPSAARYRVADVWRLREFLKLLLDPEP